MTPKEKAEELFYKMSCNSSDEDHHCSHYVARNCALIAVNEIWNELESARVFEEYDYWVEVKQELEKI
jgi:hypothetical protein